MFKEEILDNERRRKIYAAIEANQGIHLRELQRITEMPVTTLEHHLAYMTRRGVVFTESSEHRRRYYTKPLGPDERKILLALRQRMLRQIVLVTLMNKKVKYQALLDQFKLPPSTLSLYLKHLVDKNILARERIGYESVYTVIDEDRVAKVLIAYKSSFLDRLVDRALSTWMETQLQKKKAGKPG